MGQSVPGTPECISPLERGEVVGHHPNSPHHTPHSFTVLKAWMDLTGEPCLQGSSGWNDTAHHGPELRACPSVQRQWLSHGKHEESTCIMRFHAWQNIYKSLLIVTP